MVSSKPSIAASLSTNPDTAAAVQEVCAQAKEQLGGPVNLAMLFVSHHHAPSLDEVASVVCAAIGTDNLLGCTGESIAGNGREVEGEPAMTLWLASMPGTTVLPMHLQFMKTAEGGAFVGWPDDLHEQWPAEATLLLLGEPFTFPADALIDRLNDERPGLHVIGGMASGAWQPGQNKVLLGSQVFNEGAVAALVYGSLRIRSIVSQGCKPIGRPFVITKAEQNVIHELGGMPAMQRLQEVYETLSDQDKQLVRSGLHLGRVISEYGEHFGRGDFLIRNVIGADPKSGSIAVGDFFRPGQTVQFHVRDAQTADEDLCEMLAAAPHGHAAGALLFTCNGRGTRLFGEPHHDVSCLKKALGDVPVAGFFAQGELGPVAGKNFLHGFTASIALFQPIADPQQE